MRATLEIDDEMLLVARALAGRRGVSLDAQVNDLLRTAIQPRVVHDSELGFPVIVVPEGTPPIDLDRLREALDEGV